MSLCLRVSCLTQTRTCPNCRRLWKARKINKCENKSKQSDTGLTGFNSEEMLHTKRSSSDFRKYTFTPQGIRNRKWNPGVCVACCSSASSSSLPFVIYLKTNRLQWGYFLSLQTSARCVIALYCVCNIILFTRSCAQWRLSGSHAGASVQRGGLLRCSAGPTRDLQLLSCYVEVQAEESRPFWNVSVYPEKQLKHIKVNEVKQMTLTCQGSGGQYTTRRRCGGQEGDDGGFGSKLASCLYLMWILSAPIAGCKWFYCCFLCWLLCGCAAVSPCVWAWLLFPGGLFTFQSPSRKIFLCLPDVNCNTRLLYLLTCIVWP